MRCLEALRPSPGLSRVSYAPGGASLVESVARIVIMKTFAFASGSKFPGSKRPRRIAYDCQTAHHHRRGCCFRGRVCQRSALASAIGLVFVNFVVF